MQPIRKRISLQKYLLRGMVLLYVFMALASFEARAQTGSNGNDANEPEGMVSVNIKAHQCPSADLALVLLGGNPWIPWPAKDGCAPGSAGQNTFRIASGFSWPLTIYPIEAIDPDDGTVSLWWSIWSDDPVLIDGERHPSTNPLSGGSGDIDTTKYTVLAPRLEIVDTPSSAQRDEIFDITIKAAPQTFFTDRTIQFGLSQGESTTILGERGTVQMYDIGAIATDGTIIPNQTSYTLTADDPDQKPFKGVVNLAQDIKLTVTDTAMPDLTDESDSITVTHRMRQYTTEQGYVHTNDFDENIVTWVDYWDDWNYPEGSEPYTFKMAGDEIEDKLTYDLAKAVCFKESHMAFTNLMQVKDYTIPSFSSERDVNWSAEPQEDGGYKLGEGHPKMQYTGVANTPEAQSLKWGIRWLYAKKSDALEYKQETNEVYNLTWYNWTKTLEEYNGEEEKVQYAKDVMAVYLAGKNPHEGNPEYMWPIMTNGKARQ